MGQVIKRGILTGFNATNYTASLLLMEATSTFLNGVPMATHIDGTSAQIGAFCVVQSFDEQNPSDAVVLAVYPNGSQGVPSPAPGTLTLIPPVQQISTAIINAGTTSTYTIAGNGGIPSGALGILFKAYFTSPTAPAHIDLAAHGGDLSKTCSIGDIAANNQTLNGGGILPLSTDGKIDIKANGGNCTVNFFTYGYLL